jgi:AraC family transcriptional regulator
VQLRLAASRVSRREEAVRAVRSRSMNDELVRSTVLERHEGVLVHHVRRYAERAWREQETVKVVFIASGSYALETVAPTRLRAGEFIVLNPGVRHRHLHLAGEKLLVELRLEALAEAAEQLGVGLPRFAQVSSSEPQVVRWASSTLVEMREQPLGSEVMLGYALPELAVLLLRRERDGRLSRAPAAIGRALALIDEAYREPLTLDDLADVAGMERFAFAHAFRRTVGRPPFEQVRLRRVAAAASRLGERDGSVLEIALECGFGSLSAFGRAFKRAYGVSPSEYARIARS